MAIAMLRELRADGFRSLEKFSFSIEPGLNVLVGPNGAGKTNIIKFLEFLSNTTNGSISETVSRSGGVSELFSRRDYFSEDRDIVFGFSGSGPNFNFSTENAPSTDIVTYEFDARISLNQNQILFLSQTLRLWINKINYTRSNEQPDIEIAWIRDNKKTGTLSSYLVNSRKLGTRKDELYNELREFALSGMLLEAPIYHYQNYRMPFMFRIAADLNSGRAYNIVPSKAREASDIAEPPGIRPDGSGLGATIYALKRAAHHSNQFQIYSSMYHEFYSEDLFPRLKEFCRIIDPHMIDVDATSQIVENKIVVQCSFDLSGKYIERPIAILSDGTVKWLSLVTAVLTSRSAFCIEEPENYLHPRLQEEVIALLRSVLEDGNSQERFALVTTHSETLLNALYPQEVVVTRMELGSTRCTRTTDSSHIDRMINETGFGLGYFYKTGALDELD
ncbi:MAG: AAA family ATPase [Rhizobiales bacterium]|nr:AAA family ATPase [Hyphomicrobiales bacterium]